MLFFGTYPYQMDDRNRIPIPPDFRDDFSSGAFFVPSSDGCIDMLTRDGWEAQARRLAELPSDSEEVRDAQRAFLSKTDRSPKDTQNRVTIPQALVRAYNLGKNLVVVGRIDTLEIWDRAAWEAREGTLDDTRRRLQERRAAVESPQIVGKQDGIT